ncbi:hypothetical protein HDU92_008033 [Lobulomyces angularis]|nr:hypothetical protein HDU92_008033 [Lobulomyces angularis]
MSSLKLLVCGSINSNFKQFFTKANSIAKKAGPFDAILVTGDFWHEKEDQEDLSSYTAPCPIYIINGKNKIPTSTQIRINKEGQVIENVFHLGKYGIFKTAEGLSIAYLSGVYDKNQYNEKDSLNSNYYTKSEIEDLIKVSKNFTNGIDILITTEWPYGILNHSKLVKVEKNFIESNPVKDLALHLRPSSETFYEREPFDNKGVKFSTRFISLAPLVSNIDEKKPKWFYAFNIIPLFECPQHVLQLRASNTTQNPFESAKRNVDIDENTSFFFQDNSKRQKKSVPDNYICNKCGVGGHWKADCVVERRGPPDSYVCNICHEKGHYIKECPKKLNKSNFKKKDPSQCWFCLSNPEIEQHLIITVGDEVYLTMAKGPLTLDGHIILVPIKHYKSSKYLVDKLKEEENNTEITNYFSEVKKVQQLIKTEFKKLKFGLITFQIFSGNSIIEESKHHFIINYVALPEKLKLDELDTKFLEFAEKEGLKKVDSLNDLNTSCPYFMYEINDFDGATKGEIIFVPKNYGVEDNELDSNSKNTINLRFGSLVLSEAFGTPEKSDWKKCVLSTEDETKETLKWRDIIKLE